MYVHLRTFVVDLAADFDDLQLLDIDHRTRFTFEDLKKHPWFANELRNIESRTKNLRKLSSKESPSYQRDTTGLERLDLLGKTTRQQEINEQSSQDAIWHDFAWVNPNGMWRGWKPMLSRQRRAFGLV